MTVVEQAELALIREATSVDVPIEMVRTRKNKGAAFTLACDASGLEEIYMALEMDKAQFSRIKSGSANLDDDQLALFCRTVKNRIYPEWQAYQVGCTLVMIKSEAERIAEAERARADAAELKLSVLMEAFKGRAA